MTTKVITLDYVPRDPFKAFHKRSKRFSVLVCHRRAGKTVATINDIVSRALHTVKKDAFYAYVCPTFTQSKTVAWKYLKSAVAPIPNIKVNESECSVLLPNGSTIRLFGADNPDSLRGLYFDGIVLDEFGDMKGRVYTEVIRPALMDRKGWVVFIGTPRGKNAFWEQREKAIGSPKKWFYLCLKASESGLLDQAELEDMKLDMDEDEIAAEMECSFDAAIKGSYYARFINQLSINSQIRSVPYERTQPVHTAWDLGFADATAIWFFQIIAGEIRIIDHYEDSNLSIDEICDAVADKGYKLGTLYLPHDAKAKSLRTGKSLIEQILAKDLHCEIVPDHKIRDGIAAVRKTLPKCWFDAEKCYTGLEHLKNYQRKYDPDRKVFSDTPLHDNSSHTADAMRYLCLSVSALTLKKSVHTIKSVKTPTESKQEWKKTSEINIVSDRGYCLNDIWDLAPTQISHSRI